MLRCGCTSALVIADIVFRKVIARRLPRFGSFEGYSEVFNSSLDSLLSVRIYGTYWVLCHKISDMSLAFSSVHVFAGFACSEISVLVNDGKSLWEVADSIYTH